jgi:hypothetical protein
MKLQEFEHMNENNPKFHERKFKQYWKTMKQYYETSQFEAYKNIVKKHKSRVNILSLPTELLLVDDDGEKEGLMNGIRTIHSK